LKQKPDYGIDAPGVIRNLLLIGLALTDIAVDIPAYKIGKTVIITGILCTQAGYLCAIGLLMLLLFSLWKIFFTGPLLNLCYMDR